MTRIIYAAIASAVFLSPAMAADLPDICKKTSEDKVYTLYRNSPVGKGMRIHVATFDADESEEYNREHCEITREWFEKAPDVKVKYWCEKGYYKK